LAAESGLPPREPRTAPRRSKGRRESGLRWRWNVGAKGGAGDLLGKGCVGVNSAYQLACHSFDCKVAKCWSGCVACVVMEQSEARDILQKLRAELAEAHGVVEAAQRRVAALDKLVEGYIELFPELATSPAAAHTSNGHPNLIEVGGKPRGQDAVQRIMESIESKGRYWTVTAMVHEMDTRGWLPKTKGDPANAVRVALDRLAERRPDRVRKGPGSTGTLVWYWQGEGYPPPRFAGDHPLSDWPDLVAAGRQSIVERRSKSTTGGLTLPQETRDGG
jgi:hypothetical protein